MRIKNYIYAAGLALGLLAGCKEVKAPEPCGPCPNEDQIAWQNTEYYAFIHFSMNTFTDIEWGYGNVDPKKFAPTALDCDQWAETCKKAGMKGIILTCKHHDGFCLWPTATTDYSVKQSPWRDGKGDLVRELSDACRKYGLKFGIYLSPWDRNNAAYGTPEYLDIFRAQLRELLTNYGEVFEIWFDGANGGTGYYGGADENRSVDRKTYYDWPTTYQLVRELQPHAMLFSDAGPDIRWCGDEEGWVGKTNWSTLRRDEVWPGWPRYEELRNGHEDGNYWVPAEVNVSTRPGWFYHASEDHKVKTRGELLDIYYQSIGRNGTLLINFPVDRRGRIHEKDSIQIMKLAESVKADFSQNVAEGATAEATNVRGDSRRYAAACVTDGDTATYWATDDSVKQAALTIDLGKPTRFNRFLVQEYIRLGQRVKGFTVEALADTGWTQLASETTIGYKRILRLPTTTTTKVRFTVTNAKACPLISNIALYDAPKLLTRPDIHRNHAGIVTLQSADSESLIYYTLDGSEPDSTSTLYTAPFTLDHKAKFRARAYDPLTGRSSSVAEQDFDIVRKDWKVVGLDAKGTLRATDCYDGDEKTVWQNPSATMPADLVIDLGKTYTLSGFRYLPDQSRYAAGIIFNYECYVSKDGRRWELASSGEFSNIRNNPIWQTKWFTPKRARFIKLSALSNTEGNQGAAYAEVDVITQ